MQCLEAAAFGVRLASINLWDRAIQKLSKADQDTIHRYRSSQIQTNEPALKQLDHLLQVTADKRIKCENERWKFTFGDKEYVLRDVADSIIACVQKFKAIGDFAASCDPVHVALPWAAVKVLLQVSP